MIVGHPLVSVIVAVKNGGRFLASALRSVMNQDYRPFEIIVVDGHSVDDTAQIAKSFAGVRLVPQEKSGVADAYNLGIQAANGEFVAFLSHDDIWTTDKLSVQVSYLVSHLEIQYTIAHLKFFMEPDMPAPSGFRSEWLVGQHVGRIMETLVARRTLFETLGGFDPSLTTSEDVDWFARAKDSNVPMAIMSDVLLHKRIHDANISLVPANSSNLMVALKRSVERQRDKLPG